MYAAAVHQHRSFLHRPGSEVALNHFTVLVPTSAEEMVRGQPPGSTRALVLLVLRSTRDNLILWSPLPLCTTFSWPNGMYSGTSTQVSLTLEPGFYSHDSRYAFVDDYSHGRVLF